MRHMPFTVPADLNQLRVFTGSEIIRVFKGTDTVFGVFRELIISSLRICQRCSLACSYSVGLVEMDMFSS